MTGFDKPVTRRTIGKYRFTITGAFQHPDGRRLIVELKGDQHGDLIRIREEKRQQWVELDASELYLKGLRAQSARDKAERRKQGKVA